MQSVREASCGRFYQSKPAIESAASRTWVMRGARFVVALSEGVAGTRFDCSDNPDEYMLLVPPGISARVIASKEELLASDESLTIVPPGHSSIELLSAGKIVRVFSYRASDIAALAENADRYRTVPNDVAAFVPGPTPPDGLQLRHYHLKECPPTGALGRIFRSTNLMINVFPRQTIRRDPRKLTPHSHNDFEQASLTLEGDFIHHLRVPWGADLNSWREDCHLAVSSPSLLVIPPGMIHTTRDVGEGITWLIDIFSPPRADFSARPGWVRNASDYPTQFDDQSTHKMEGGEGPHLATE